MEKVVNLHPSWLTHLAAEFNAPYMAELKKFLLAEYEQGKVIFPKKSEYFNALNFTPLDQVKVVILGQDPYHGPGQAHGLSFSVPPGIPAPPSLVNIFKELKADLGVTVPKHGYLKDWAQSGVLLLNSVLTVEQGQAGAHANRGWERFTDRVIEVISKERAGVVFILWGAYAQKKGAMIDRQKHLVLTAPHPSPLSAHRGFLGSRPFSQANQYLQGNGQTPVNWALASVP